jgi:hypothetical protein
LIIFTILTFGLKVEKVESFSVEVAEISCQVPSKDEVDCFSQAQKTNSKAMIPKKGFIQY